MLHLWSIKLNNLKLKNLCLVHIRNNMKFYNLHIEDIDVVLDSNKLFIKFYFSKNKEIFIELIDNNIISYNDTLFLLSLEMYIRQNLEELSKKHNEIKIMTNVSNLSDILKQKDEKIVKKNKI